MGGVTAKLPFLVNIQCDPSADQTMVPFVLLGQSCVVCFCGKVLVLRKGETSVGRGQTKGIE